MGSTAVLDLRGVALPVSLLKCTSALAGLGDGDTLEVLVYDPEVAEDLVRIIERSRGRAIHSKQEGNFYRIRVGPHDEGPQRRDPGRGSNGMVPQSNHSDKGRYGP